MRRHRCRQYAARRIRNGRDRHRRVRRAARRTRHGRNRRWQHAARRASQRRNRRRRRRARRSRGNARRQNVARHDGRRCRAIRRRIRGRRAIRRRIRWNGLNARTQRRHRARGGRACHERRRERRIRADRHAMRRDGPAGRQSVAAHRRDAAGRIPVREVHWRRIPPPIGRDAKRPVVTRPATRRARAKRRHVRLAPPERNPAVDRPRHGSGRPARTAVPRHERRRPQRARDERARAPSPAAADVRPAAVVERRIAPRSVVHPRVAPSRQPGPVAESVRSPFARDVRRKPDGAVVGIGLPRPVRREIVRADHPARNVCGLPRFVVHPIACGAPRVERVDRRRVAHVGRFAGNARQRRHLAGEHLHAAGTGRELRFTDAHGDARLRTVGCDVDAIKARADERNLGRRRRDANRIVGVLHVHANDDAAFVDEQREGVVGEPRDTNFGAAVEPEQAAAVVDFRPSARRERQARALGHRIVLRNRRPRRRVVSLVRQRAVHTRDTTRAATLVVLRERRHRDRDHERRDESRTALD